MVQQQDTEIDHQLHMLWETLEPVVAEVEHPELVQRNKRLWQNLDLVAVQSQHDKVPALPKHQQHSPRTHRAPQASKLNGDGPDLVVARQQHPQLSQLSNILRHMPQTVVAHVEAAQLPPHLEDVRRDKLELGVRQVESLRLF